MRYQRSQMFEDTRSPARVAPSALGTSIDRSADRHRHRSASSRRALVMTLKAKVANVTPRAGSNVAAARAIPT